MAKISYLGVTYLNNPEDLENDYQSEFDSNLLALGAEVAGVGDGEYQCSNGETNGESTNTNGGTLGEGL